MAVAACAVDDICAEVAHCCARQHVDILFMLLGFACGSMLVVPCIVGYEYEGKASYAYISQVLSAVAVGSSVGDRSAARTLRGNSCYWEYLVLGIYWWVLQVTLKPTPTSSGSSTAPVSGGET
jgi:hypothetical protein